MSPVDVVRRHVDAVRSLDLDAMSADYSLDAVLTRGDVRHVGRDAIARYFATVPDRLDGRAVELDRPVQHADGTLTVRWRVAGAGISGTDTYVVRDGRIVEQTVALDDADF